MSTRLLLDTNALSQLIRDPRGTVGTRLREVGDSNVFTSIIVACELRDGACKRGSTVLTERVERLLASINVAPLESGVDALYAEIRHELESQGTPIGSNDLLIAAHALEQSATLVAGNVDEFARVPGPLLENWVRPARPDPIKPASTSPSSGPVRMADRTGCARRRCIIHRAAYTSRNNPVPKNSTLPSSSKTPTRTVSTPSLKNTTASSTASTKIQNIVVTPG